jgi:hypothetical protein
MGSRVAGVFAIGAAAARCDAQTAEGKRHHHQ